MEDNQKKNDDINASTASTVDENDKSFASNADDTDEPVIRSDRKSSTAVRKRSTLGSKSYGGEDQALDKISRKV